VKVEKIGYMADIFQHNRPPQCDLVHL